MPAPQINLLAIMSLAAFIAASLTTLPALRKAMGKGLLGQLLMGTGGIVFASTAVAVRAAQGHGPLSSGFDTFLFFAILSGLLAVYFALMRSLPAIHMGLMPLAAGNVAIALVLSYAGYRQFAGGVWNIVHIGSAIAGILCITIAARGGLLYLRTHYRLRRKDPAALIKQGPSLEALDQMIRRTMTVGFALLTIAGILGIVRMFQLEDSKVSADWTHPKLIITFVAWCLCSAAVHVSFAKRFRGILTACLSILTLCLLLAVLGISLFLTGR